MSVFQITASSVVGCVRENNEDMILVDGQFVRNKTVNLTSTIDLSTRYLLALADGMGGHNCGEVASQDVLQNLQFYFNDIPAGLTTDKFNEAIYEWLGSMNNNIEAKGRSDAQFEGMGTTLVALALYENKFFWMNCGDSRLYRLHNGKLRQLTVDHSLNNLTGEKKHSHIVTNCIGGGCKTSYIDIIDCTNQIAPGDTFLLCSDGLTDMVDDDVIQQKLLEGANAEELCRLAENEGGLDNVSVVIARYE